MILDGNSKVGEAKVYGTKKEMELSRENEKLKDVILAIYNIDAKFIDESHKVTYKDYYEAIMNLIEEKKTF